MELLLLSNTRGSNNAAVFRAIKKILRGRGRIAYLPASPDRKGKYFHDVVGWFQQISPDWKIDYCDIWDDAIYPSLASTLLGYDCFYLSGGQVKPFFDRLQELGLDSFKNSLCALGVFCVVGFGRRS